MEKEIVCKLCENCIFRCNLRGTNLWHCLIHDSVPSEDENCIDYINKDECPFNCKNCENFDGFYEEEEGNVWSCEAGEIALNLTHAWSCKYFHPVEKVRAIIFRLAKECLRNT